MDNEALKEVFLSLHAQTAREVNPDSVIDVLLSKKVISSDDYFELRKVQHSRDRCRDLLALLYRSSHPEAFIQLHLALQDDYPWIVEEIDKRLESQTAEQRQPQQEQSTVGEKEVSHGASSRDGQTAQCTSSQQTRQRDDTVETSPQSHLSSGEKEVSHGASSRDGQTAQCTSSEQTPQEGDTEKTFLPSYLSSAARVIDIISTGHSVLGVTSAGDELFVLLGRGENQVAVYSIDDYQLLRHLSVPGYVPGGASDIESCANHKCLYASDYDSNRIHRYDLASSATSECSVPGKPIGLSLTDSGNLLVTCREHNTLVEMTAGGDCVREIAQSDIEYPWHAVQLSTGEFVLCHGGGFLSVNRVCLADSDGNLTHSYGGQQGSDVGQLNYPCHLSVDKDWQFVFVADLGNDRVVLLSPTLEFVRYVIEGLSRPYRLYFHQSTRRLFVGQWGCDVIVVQL